MVPEHPQRKNIRLPGYDYSQAGCYFITICTQNRQCYFGEIVGATLCGLPNIPHQMIERWLLELENRFWDVTIPEYIIMPNHVHFIVQKMLSPDDNGVTVDNTQGNETGDHIGSPLRDIIGWFKTMTTNEYIRNVRQGLYVPFNKRLWQRNYYEHIIRNENEYLRIAEYIRTNPSRWMYDSLREEQNNA